jgi:pilus assembly protein FimV
LAINRDKVYDAAMKLLTAGKFDKGIVELQKLVADDPRDVRTHLKIAETLHVKMGKRKEALESYDRAASVYVEQGFFLKGVAVFKQMLSVEAQNPDLHLRLAELYQQMGYGAQCLHHYQQVVVLYEQQGRGREMLAVLKRMVDLDPENLQSRVKVAELFYIQGMVAEAIAEMRQAFDFLRSQDRVDDALRVGEKVCAWDPTAADVARQLGALYLQRGEAKTALSKLQICYAQAPRDVEVLGLIANAFLAIDQVGKTISVYKEMARIFDGDGNADEAQRCWELVLQYAPGDEDAEAALGRQSVAPPPPPPPPPVENAEEEQLKRLLTETDVYVKYGLRDKAIEHLNRIFELRPEYLPGLEKLRQLQKQTRQASAAVETLRRMVNKARELNHPRLADWSAELTQLEASAAPPKSTPPRAAVSTEQAPASQPEAPSAPTTTAPTTSPKAATLIRGAPAIRGAPPPVIDEPLDEPLDEPVRPKSPTTPRARIESLDEDLPPVTAREPARAASSWSTAAPRRSEPAVDAPPPPTEGPPESQATFGDDEMGMLDDLAAQAVNEAMPHFARNPSGVLELSSEELDQLEDVARAATQPAEAEENDDFNDRTIAYGGPDWPAQPRATKPAGDDDSLLQTGEYRVAAAVEAVVEFAEDTGAIPPVATASDVDAFVTDPMAARAAAPPDEPDPDAFDPNQFDLPDDVKALLAPRAETDHLGQAAPDADPFEPAATMMIDPRDIQSLHSAPYATFNGSHQALAIVAAVEADVLMPPPFAAPPAAVDDVPDGPSMSRELFAPQRGFEDDPANTFFPDELAEAEFFIQQDLLDEAREILEPILAEIEDSERVRHMLARVAAREAGEPEPPPPWQQRIIADVAAEAAPAPETSDPGQVSVEEVLSQFKKGIAETVPEDDAATHYDLGIAYREMGLLDDAIGEFEVAARAAARAPDAWFLVGLVRIEQGRVDDALAALDRALASPTASREQRAAAEYQRGVVLSERGQGLEGLRALKRSKLLGGATPDLDRRIQSLVKLHGDVDASQAPTAAPAVRAKNVAL